MLIRFLRILTVAALLVGASSADAATITYTFEAPQFLVGQTTPLNNVAPNIGPVTFLTTFTSNPTGNGFVVATGGNFPPGAGQFLLDPFAVSDTLLLAFNTPVFSLEIDFAVNLVNGDPAGFLTLLTPAGGINQASGNIGGTFQGGTLIFNSAIPFTSAQLSAFNAAGAPILFAANDLVLTVPEPATSVLLLVGVAAIARRRFAARVKG